MRRTARTAFFGLPLSRRATTLYICILSWIYFIEPRITQSRISDNPLRNGERPRTRGSLVNAHPSSVRDARGLDEPCCNNVVARCSIRARVKFLPRQDARSMIFAHEYLLTRIAIGFYAKASTRSDAAAEEERWESGVYVRLSA